MNIRFSQRPSLANVSETLQNQQELYNQKHLILHHKELNKENKDKLTNELLQVDYSTLDFLYFNFLKQKISTHFGKKKVYPQISRIGPDTTCWKLSDTDRIDYYEKGLKEISEGKLAVILLASEILFHKDHQYESMATKNLDLPSKSNILEVMIQKVKALANQAIKKYGKNYIGNREPILQCIMTSETENDNIYTSQELENFYGYSSTYVFPQSDLPLFSKEGKIILKSDTEIHKFPNGDGGIFTAIRYVFI